MSYPHTGGPQNDDGYESEEETLDKESQESSDNPIKTFEYKLPTSNKNS